MFASEDTRLGSASSAWKADFEGAFGTKELLSSLEEPSHKPLQDAPGEEWTDFNTAESHE